MKVEFQHELPDPFLIVTPETREESESLWRWNNCVLSAEFGYDRKDKEHRGYLKICKEI